MKKSLSKLYNKINNPLFREIRRNRLQTKINTGLAKGMVSASKRNIDLTNPISWEFSGYSQNGEDGILEILIDQLTEKNRYFVEIGSSNCIDNNTAWLAHVHNYAGLMVEGDTDVYSNSMDLKPWYVDYLQLFVNLENIEGLKKYIYRNNPDVFSLDIDGNDYHIIEKFFTLGFMPKICVVEYNSAFGPDKKLTIPYNPEFSVYDAHPSHLFYGVSLNLYKDFFTSKDYQFITVDSNGVNAFFVDKKYFKPEFLSDIKGLSFKENLHQYRKFKFPWEKQFEEICNMNFMEIQNK